MRVSSAWQMFEMISLARLLEIQEQSLFLSPDFRRFRVFVVFSVFGEGAHYENSVVEGFSFSDDAQRRKKNSEKKSPGHDECTHIAAMCLIASDNLFLKSFLCVVKRERK
jgi:hypothetical protein